MQDAWRAYLEMALGLTEAPRKKAQKAVGELVSRGGATAAQLQGLVEDLMSTGMANRTALTNLVRYEVDRALGVVGLATAEEVHDLTARVRDLEKQLKAAQARAEGVESAPTGAGLGGDRIEKPAPLPARKTVAKKAVTKAPPNQMPSAATAPATKTTAKKATKATPPAPAGTATSPVAEVKDAAAATELPPAKKAVAKKAAKKAVAKKTTSTPAKKAQPAKKTQPEAGQ